MKKGFIRGAMLLSVAVLGAFGITSCGPNTKTTSTTTVTDIVKEKHTITFVTNCDMVFNSIQGVEGSKMILPTPTKEGYIFQGWFTDSQCKTKYTSDEFPNGDITLYAGWEAKTYKITFVTKAKEGVSPILAHPGDTIELPTPVNEGYSFLGWYTIDNEPYTSLVMPKENITLYAKWSLTSCTVTLMDTLHSLISYEVCQKDGTVSITDLDDQDYIFQGWYYDSEYKEKYNSTDKIQENITLYSKWIAKNYTITFEEYEGTLEGHVGEKLDLPVLIKEGHTFLGWSTSENLSNPSMEYIIPSGGREKPLLPVFEIKVYTLEFDTKGGTAIKAEAYEYGSKIYPPADPVRGGYEFAGWKQTIPETMPAKDLVIEANWTAGSYTISYELNGGSFDGEVKTNYKTNSTMDYIPIEPEKAGYEFIGWYFDSAFEEETIGIPKGTYGNKTLYAKWKAIEYSITYNLNGGSIPSNAPTSFTLEDEISLPKPSKNGYDFKGWYEDLTDVSSRIDTITVGTTRNIEVTAKWQITQYTITYETNGGDITDSKKTVYVVTDSYTFPEPTKTGYKFLGWYTDESYEDIYYLFSIEPGQTGNLSLYAKWEIEKYEIVYNTNGGAMPSGTRTYYTYFEEETINFLNPIWNGAVFKGWFKDEDLTKPATSIAPHSTGAITLYAKWELISYTITYNLDGGAFTDTPETTYQVTDSYTFLEPERDGFTFKGWYLDDTFSRRKTQISEGEYGNIALFAKWGPLEYSIEYILNGGHFAEEDVIEEVYTVEESILLKTPIYKDHTFRGWYKDAECKTTPITTTSGQYENLTLYAKWVKTTYTITYVLDGGTNDVSNPTEYNKDQSFTFAEPTRSGYVFEGWYTDAEFTNAITGVERGTRKNLTLYAKWSAIFVAKNGVIKGFAEGMETKYPDLVFPDKIDGVTITSIEQGSFANNIYIRSVTLNQYITGLGNYSFEGCSALTTVNFNSVITNLGAGTFRYTALEAVEIPASVTGLGIDLFKGTKLVSITIPSQIKYSYSGMLAECEQLTSISIYFTGINPVPVEDSDVLFGNIFGKTSFANSVEITQQIGDNSYTFYLPKSLKTVNFLGTKVLNYAFNGCTNITTINLPNTYTIGKYAFHGCDNLETINAPKLSSIGEYAFAYCDGFETIDISNLTLIESYTFYKCYSLTSISAPLVTKVEDHAFYSCLGLEDVSLPKATTIGDYAFYFDTGLKTLSLPLVTSLGGYALSECSELVSLDIPNVTHIGEYGLCNCYSLNSLTIPLVKDLGRNALTNVRTVKELSLPNVEKMGVCCLSGMTKLKELTVAFVGLDSNYPLCVDNLFFEMGTTGWNSYALSKVTVTRELSGYTFANSGLVGINVDLGDDVTKIPSGCFTNARINVLNALGVKTIDENAFYGANVTTMNYAVLETIEYEAFTNGQFVSVSLPDSVKRIGSGILHNSLVGSLSVPFIGETSDSHDASSIGYLMTEYGSDSYLETIEFRGTYIVDSCFSGCSKVTTFTMPNVNTIGDYAFAGMTSLKKITFPEETLTYVGKEVLKNCSAIEEISIPFSGASSLITATTQYNIMYLFSKDSSFSNYTEMYLSTLSKSDPSSYSTVRMVKVPDTLRLVEFTGDMTMASLSNLTIKQIVLAPTCTLVEENVFFNTTAPSGSLHFYIESVDLSSFKHGCFLTCCDEVTIHYEGTKSQWNARMASADLLNGQKATVICTDGTLEYA